MRLNWKDLHRKYGLGSAPDPEIAAKISEEIGREVLANQVTQARSRLRIGAYSAPRIRVQASVRESTHRWLEAEAQRAGVTVGVLVAAILDEVGGEGGEG